MKPIIKLPQQRVPGILALSVLVCVPAAARRAFAETPAKPVTEKAAAQAKWKPLFDGKSLTGWKVTEYGGEGDVYVKEGKLFLDYGTSLTGITYSGKPPKMNYELSLEAKRVEGIDFFCGLTFPVNDSHCSLIVGGWAGTVVGLSSIDGRDASENDTTRIMVFKDDRWYAIRVRVTPKRIEAWIDGKQVVNQVITGRKISTRPEVDLNKPLGICAWETKAALRHIRWRPCAAPDEKGKGAEAGTPTTK